MEAALKGGRVDRPPAAAWGHTYREEWSPAALARVTAQRQARYGWDFVKFQPRASSFAEAFGAVYKSSNHALRAPKETAHPIHGYKDWPSIGPADASAPSLAAGYFSWTVLADACKPAVARVVATSGTMNSDK